MRYPFKVRPDGRFFLATFPDIPEAITQGETMEQELAVAQDALETALEFYFEGLRAVREPSPIKRGRHFVELSASLSAKVLLL
jgi:antitoxin HicB